MLGELVQEAKAKGVKLSQVIKTAKTNAARALVIATGIYSPDVTWLHDGQRCAWELDRDSYDVIAIIAGKQGGKSTFGLPAFYREIQLCGPGHYCLTGPSYVVLNKRMIPDIKQDLVERGWAVYNENKHEIVFTELGMLAFYGTSDRHTLYERFKFVSEDGTVERKSEFKSKVTIFVIEASDPKKLEAGTYKAALAEEWGSTDVREQAFDNLVNGRLVRYRGKCIIVTTPYDVNWLKYRIFDACEEAGAPEGSPEYLVGIDRKNRTAVVRFESWMNPTFGRDKFDQIRASGMPEWYFDMMYRGIFTRPTGMIFDCFDRGRHLTSVGIGQIPYSAPRIWGMDFGPLNMAAVKVAILHDGVKPRAVVYMSYHPAQKLETADHVQRIKSGENAPICKGGNATSEDGWRKDFGNHGLYIGKPKEPNHEVRIQVLYSLLQRGDLLIYNRLEELIREIETYKRVVNNEGNVTDEIKDKAGFHRLDALLYIAQEIDDALRIMEIDKT